MQLLFEGKRISELNEDLNTDEGRFLKLYNSWKDQIKKVFKKQVVLDFVNEVITNANPYDPNSRPERPQGWSIMAKHMYVGNDFSGEVRYFESEKRDKNGKPLFSPRRVDFKGKTILSTVKDIDKLIYFTFISPYAKKDEWLRGQNQNHKYNVYRIINEVKDSEKYLENIKLESKAQSIIFGETMDIKADEEIYRDLAAAYNVTQAYDRDLITVQKDLYNIIFFRMPPRVPNYNYARMRSFIEDGKALDIRVSVGALIKRGTDLNVLFVDKRGTSWWKYKDSTLNTDIKVCKADEADKKAQLIAYLLSDKKMREVISDLVAKKEKEVGSGKNS